MSEAGRLRVMSLNLRGPDEGDPTPWPRRLPVVTRILRERLPDVVGTQEGLYLRLEELADSLHDLDYRWIGLGREGGSHSEHGAIFYRASRLQAVDLDHFWLSKTPKTIGSSFPESTPGLPRMVTWVRLRERGTGREVVVVNTHLDHRSEEARTLSASLLSAFVAERLEAGDSLVLTGDFNAAAVSSRPYRILTERLQDTWRAASGGGQRRFATYHGYRQPALEESEEACIDWILASAELKPVSAEVVASVDEGPDGIIYPTDHWPVLADLDLGE